MARITLWKVGKTVVGFAAFGCGAGWVVWKGVLVKRWVEDVEYEGNVDAERALEAVEGGEESEGGEAKKKNKGGGKSGKK